MFKPITWGEEEDIEKVVERIRNLAKKFSAFDITTSQNNYFFLLKNEDNLNIYVSRLIGGGKRVTFVIADSEDSYLKLQTELKE